MTPNPMGPRAVLFDMDGVLVRSTEVWARVVSEAGVRFRGRPIEREEFLPTFGQGAKADVEVFGLSCTPKELDAFYAANFMRYAEHLWTNPEAAPLLERLRWEGRRVAVVTNTTTPLARDILETARLWSLFHFVGCADQVKAPKPAPDLVHHVLAKVGAPATDAWMIGDSKYDRGAAEAAAVRFVGFGIDGAARIEELSQLPKLYS